MIDITTLRETPETFRDAIRLKRLGEPSTVDRLVELDANRRTALTRSQQVREEANQAAREIGELMKSGRREEAQERIQRSSQLKSESKDLDELSRALDKEFAQLLLEIPNPPHDSVPKGSTEADNTVAFQSPDLPDFPFEPKPHWEIVATHGLVDFDRGSKVAGAGFPFYVGAGARFQRALIQFFLDAAVEAGYTEIQPPIVVNTASATGTGQLPDKEAQMYEVPRDQLYLIPTSEVPVTNYHRDEILREEELPIRYCAYTPCFRREAGSHGKDVRGLNRLHQFDKVEIVQLVHPDRSYDALEEMREHTESLIQALGLPYRRLVLCTGEMGFTQSKTYDLEVWSAGQGRWLEVSSVSNTEGFQARRMNIRFRPVDGGKVAPVHTLNGSALALPRIVASLMEQYQQQDGSVAVPAVLQRYTGFERIG